LAKPPCDARPLLEALKEWGEPGQLVEPLCENGEWICWARRGSRDGPWVKLPVEAWEQIPHRVHPRGLRIISPDYMQRVELVRAPERFSETGRKVPDEEPPRRVVLEHWFSPVFLRIAIGPELPYRERERVYHDWCAQERQRNPREPTRTRRRAKAKELDLPMAVADSPLANTPKGRPPKLAK
jgi:hypothetical protein